MFSVHQTQTSAFNHVVLKDEKLQTEVVILPSCGAILHQFSVLHNSNTVNVIESYDSEADFKANAESKGFRNIKMSPFACRIKNAQYNHEGVAYTIEKFLLNGSAIHGLLYNEAFTVTNTWANETCAGVTLLHIYKATDKGYPFYFTCQVSYQLKAENTLTLSTSIINNSVTTIPVQDGWHPYFTFGKPVNELQLQFNSDYLLEFDDSLVPTKKVITYTDFNTPKKLGDTFFDNCFILKKDSSLPACILKDAEQQLQLEIYPHSSYPYLQIYTPPHRQSIAIENISAAPDSFNNGMGLLLLKPETTAQFETTYKITSLL